MFIKTLQCLCFYSSASVNHDSVTVSLHSQTDGAKCNSANRSLLLTLVLFLLWHVKIYIYWIKVQEWKNVTDTGNIFGQLTFLQCTRHLNRCEGFFCSTVTCLLWKIPSLYNFSTDTKITLPVFRWVSSKQCDLLFLRDWNYIDKSEPKLWSQISLLMHCLHNGIILQIQSMC